MEPFIQEYSEYKEEDVLALYASVGWTAYTDDPEALRDGFSHSLLTLAAYDGEQLLGLIRAVSDGYTVVFIQDILVFPEFQRMGIGTALMRAMLARFPAVRQIELATDDTSGTITFYRALGFRPFPELGCCALMRI